MKIGRTLYITNRKAWRSWLARNHASKKDIWLIYYRKDSGKPRIPYDVAVEEALCFGWIDSIVKNIDHERFAQRFTPRNPKSKYSETNKERLRTLIARRKVKKTVLDSLEPHLAERFTIPRDILDVVKSDKKIWKNFQHFPDHYKRIRVAFIDGARKRPEVFQQRLNYFLKMTSQNKKYGTMK